jgi:hypothetical protein
MAKDIRLTEQRVLNNIHRHNRTRSRVIIQVVTAVCLVATVLAQRQQQQQQQYFDNGQGLLRKSQPTDDQRASASQDRYTTPVPIIRFDKEQAADGSYKTRYVQCLEVRGSVKTDLGVIRNFLQILSVFFKVSPVPHVVGTRRQMSKYADS